MAERLWCIDINRQQIYPYKSRITKALQISMGSFECRLEAAQHYLKIWTCFVRKPENVYKIIILSLPGSGNISEYSTFG